MAFPPNALVSQGVPMNRAIEWLGNSAPNIKQPWTLTINIVKPHFPHNVTQGLVGHVCRSRGSAALRRRCGIGAASICARICGGSFGTDIFNETGPQSSARFITAA